jgi:glycosyltransferase involved in cell wall biosynthesis
VPLRASVVLSTYRQPRALELVLHAYAAQSARGFEVVVADDGSGPDTARVVERMRREHGLGIVHVWHPDRGFRKTEILNRALLAASGDYLLFSDGDCVPRDDFVATHLRLAAPGRFLSGGYLKLPAALTAALTVDDVRAMRHAEPGWLRARGWRPGRRALRLTRSGALATLLDRLTPTRPSWNGHNASGWKADLLRANGFDLRMGYGGEDRALGECLENAGVRGVQLRHRAPLLHLHHERPYLDPARIAENRRLRAGIRRGRLRRAAAGIAEMEPDPELRVTR